MITRLRETHTCHQISCDQLHRNRLPTKKLASKHTCDQTTCDVFDQNTLAIKKPVIKKLAIKCTPPARTTQIALNVP